MREKNSILKHVADSDGRLVLYSQISKNFVNERNTWRLLGKLYNDRLTPNDDEEEILSAGMARTSEKMLISKLFRFDRDLREGQIVVDWLEMNARQVSNESISITSNIVCHVSKGVHDSGF